MKKKIMIGMCTFNRKYILEMCALSFNNIKNIQDTELRLYDDCSTEYNDKYLRQIFPTVKKVSVSNRNCGADKNAIVMLKDFLDSTNEWLFIADSDLIFSRELVFRLDKIIDDISCFTFKGIVSVFNAITHKEINQISNQYIEKEKLGAAAVILDKATAQIIVETNNENEHYDNCFSRVLKERKYKLLCTQKSYVQHIGIEGYNSFFYAFDWGRNYEIDTLQNAQIIEKILDLLFCNIVTSNNNNINARIRNDIRNRRIGLKGIVGALVYCLKYKIIT